MPPDFALERAAATRLARAAPGAQPRIAGVDEAGRGPLAGPVLAAAVVFRARVLPHALAWGLDDSKALAAAERVRLAAALWDAAAEGLAECALGAASVAEIERHNILGATFLAMRRALARLPGGPPDLALIDGNRCPPGLACPAEAAVGGDARSLSIAAASILAKVERDALLRNLDARFPGYDLSRNAGYGSAAHRAALLRLGPTPEHRRSFGALAQGRLF